MILIDSIGNKDAGCRSFFGPRSRSTVLRQKKTDGPGIGPQNEKDRVPDPRSLYII